MRIHSAGNYPPKDRATRWTIFWDPGWFKALRSMVPWYLAAYSYPRLRVLGLAFLSLAISYSFMSGFRIKTISNFPPEVID